jgi:hypothetical protein
MAFLKLMGITVPVLEEGGGEVTLVQQGEYGRSFSGAPYNAVRATSEDYRGRWPLVARDASTAYSLLVRGAGHGFRFATAGSGANSDYYSSKGLAPVLTTGVVNTAATGGAVSNGGRLEISDTPNAAWSMPASPLNEATLSCWVKNPDADPDGTNGDWIHFVVESSGDAAVAAWVDGVSTSLGSLPAATLAVDTWLTHPSSGSYEGSMLWALTGFAASSNTLISEVMCLPFRASLLESTWASWAYNAGAGRRAEMLSYLSMEGTWTRTGSDTVQGEVYSETLRTVASGDVYGSGSFRLMSTGTAS